MLSCTRDASFCKSEVGFISTGQSEYSGLSYSVFRKVIDTENGAAASCLPSTCEVLDLISDTRKESHCVCGCADRNVSLYLPADTCCEDIKLPWHFLTRRLTKSPTCQRPSFKVLAFFHFLFPLVWMENIKTKMYCGQLVCQFLKQHFYPAVSKAGLLD